MWLGGAQELHKATCAKAGLSQEELGVQFQHFWKLALCKTFADMVQEVAVEQEREVGGFVSLEWHTSTQAHIFYRTEADRNVAVSKEREKKFV